MATRAIQMLCGLVGQKNIETPYFSKRLFSSKKKNKEGNWTNLGFYINIITQVQMRTLGDPPAPSDPRWSLRREPVHTRWSVPRYEDDRRGGGSFAADILFNLSPAVLCSFGRHDSWQLRPTKPPGKQKEKILCQPSCGLTA